MFGSQASLACRRGKRKRRSQQRKRRRTQKEAGYDTLQASELSQLFLPFVGARNNAPRVPSTRLQMLQGLAVRNGTDYRYESSTSLTFVNLLANDPGISPLAGGHRSG